MRYFLSSSENGIFSSVAIFTFVIPKLIHLLTSSKLTPEAPCNTNGTDTLLLISASLSKSSFGSLFYRPCAVPIATANESIPVLSTYSTAASGFV